MKYFVILLAVTQLHCQGSEYTIPLLGHGSEGETYTVDVQYQVVNPSSTTVTVGSDFMSFPNVAGGTAEARTIQINETDVPVQSQLKNLTRVVTTSGSVNLQVITTKGGHSEGYQAIPNDLLGNEYYVSTFCALGGYCQMVIGSTVPGTTQVYVNLPTEVSEIGFCIVNGTWTSSSDTTITLVYPEVVQLESTHDLTGTRIYSDNPVAVVAGSRRKAMGATPEFHLAEQLAPVTSWGTEFFVRAIGVNNYGGIITITNDQLRTYVTMDGFPPVELTGEGMSITRRVERLGVTRIKATRPVQVMMYTGFTYNTNETIVNPGMTLVPATEHYHSSYKVACANTVPSDTLQLVRETLTTITGLGTVIATTAVPYRKYTFVDHGPFTGAISVSSSNAFSGIMTCGGSAIFPISILTKPTVTCLPTAAGVAFPGDGVDNDCDGVIDEDQCYENRVFRTSYTFFDGTFTGQAPRSESIVGFSLIKFRLRSCGDVKIELRGTDASGTVGKLVISIAKEALVIYYCFPSCTSHVFIDTSAVLGQADCSTLVPYWIVKTTSNLCMNTGPFPDFDCSSTSDISISGHDFTDMFMFGLHSNAVFYYDVYRPDCRGLESNWRCEDKVYNCWEFENLCTDETYTDWIIANCAKFCELCVPDSVGQMFAVIKPKASVTMQYNLVPSSCGTFSSVVSGNAYPFTTNNAVTKDNGTVKVQTSFVASGVKSVNIVYTSDASNLIVTATRSSYDSLSIPVYPLDTLGTEFMTLSFSKDAMCDVISPDGPAHVWTSTANVTTDRGTFYPTYKHILLTSADYIGTVITSDRPVAVFCSRINSTQFIEYWAQLIPTSSWGTTYFIPRLDEPNTLSATVRIITNSANTRVEIDGDLQAVIILDERGEYLDQPINPAVNFTFVSNFPIAIVVQYTDTTTGGQSVLTVPSAENFMNDAAIYYNDVTGRVVFGVASTDLTFMTEEAESDATGRLYYSTAMSGSFAMSTFNFSSEPGTEVTNHPVRQSSHLVKDLFQMCTVTKATADDGIDNDCDGLVDEEEDCETGYGSDLEDLDLDGAFGEDCKRHIPPAITLIPPDIPQCNFLAVQLPVTNESVCYTACLAPCSWVEHLNAYKNMTQEEKDASNLADIQKYIAILKVDESLLQATTNEKESAPDYRESSINIGIVGVVMFSLICTLIVFFDFVNVYKWLKKRRQTSTAKDLQSKPLAPRDFHLI